MPLAKEPKFYYNGPLQGRELSEQWKPGLLYALERGPRNELLLYTRLCKSFDKFVGDKMPDYEESIVQFSAVCDFDEKKKLSHHTYPFLGFAEYGHERDPESWIQHLHFYIKNCGRPLALVLVEKPSASAFFYKTFPATCAMDEIREFAKTFETGNLITD